MSEDQGIHHEDTKDTKDTNKSGKLQLSSSEQLWTSVQGGGTGYLSRMSEQAMRSGRTALSAAKSLLFFVSFVTS